MSRKRSGRGPTFTGNSGSPVTKEQILQCLSEHGFDQWDASQWSKWVLTHFLPTATTSKLGRRRVKTSCGHTYSLTIYLAQAASAWQVNRWVGQVSLVAHQGRIFTLDIGPTGGYVVDHMTGGLTHFPTSESKTTRHSKNGGK